MIKEIKQNFHKIKIIPSKVVSLYFLKVAYFKQSLCELECRVKRVFQFIYLIIMCFQFFINHFF